MEAFRQKQVRCRAMLAPVIAKEKNERPLRVFHAPAHGNDAEGDAFSDKFGHLSPRKQRSLCIMCFNLLQRIQNISSETLTDMEAERLMYPFHASSMATPFEEALVAFTDKFKSTVGQVSWNKPVVHAEWETELRFWGQWWLSLRIRADQGTMRTTGIQGLSRLRGRISWAQGMDGTPLVCISTPALIMKFHEGKEENRYPPLLTQDAGVAEENQLIADLAKRLTGPTRHLDVFHLSGLRMTPDRLHVLFFDGFSKLPLLVETEVATETEGSGSQDGQPQTIPTTAQRRGNAAPGEQVEETLATLSFSACQMGSAGLLVLLTGVASLAAQGLKGISSLDLSYNELRSTSLYSFTQMLRFTFVTRLSLRGNNLASIDVTPFREFLLEGCDLQIEELDLSYTELTPAQVGVLIESLPLMNRIRVLLLEEVTIPVSKWPLLVRAVERTQLWQLRLLPSTALSTSSTYTPISSIVIYVKLIEEICANNERLAKEASAGTVACSGFFGFNTPSFFEAFFSYSQIRGGAAGECGCALPEGYTAFTNNDPSLI
ncbi:hypothetical protein ABL78_6059 [Leptomonas seymouri]|uniref:Leucine-rich repeat protein n=1 Tax=Leptomonas seymouri TaxID=5684 RepID=A0A0N0P4I9_LEPSE|nr:hypothetical protein ABL78_6059 [Leptomonas seymouri]|eukprot:KPI84877.1 hypothetical protein ABL78_6059 [Leptomonas seymouri]